MADAGSLSFPYIKPFSYANNSKTASAVSACPQDRGRDWSAGAESLQHCGESPYWRGASARDHGFSLLLAFQKEQVVEQRVAGQELVSLP